MIIERTARNERVILCTTLPCIAPVYAVCKRLVLVEARRYLPLLWVRPIVCCEIHIAGTVEVEADNFEPVVHARNKKVVLARRRGVPFDTPGTTADFRLGQRSKGLAGIEEPDGVVVAVQRSCSILSIVRRSNEVYLPTAIICSM